MSWQPGQRDKLYVCAMLLLLCSCVAPRIAESLRGAGIAILARLFNATYPTYVTPWVFVTRSKSLLASVETSRFEHCFSDDFSCEGYGEGDVSGTVLPT